ncbi:hypothetical protein J2W47_005620 [Priestia megaterium]|nr:hypothetical protein [Priestia megaterium]
MSDSTGFRKFNIRFNIIILIFALSVVISTLYNYGNMDRSLLYLILGIGIGIGSVVRLYKLFRPTLQKK